MGSIISVCNDKNYDSVKSKYFNSVNQIINQHYESNITPKRLNANASICFENKSFDGVYASEETQAQSYIEWLQYLYNYLTIEIGDKEWAQEMIILLDDELFLSENKYLSQFFFRDFFMSLEPNCIKDSKNNNSVNNDIYEEGSYEMRTSINNSDMMRALGGSIGPNAAIDDETDNNINLSINADSDSKYKSYRNKVKKYIEIFREHIINKDHPINRVIQIFEKVWVKYIREHTEKIKNKDLNDIEKENTIKLIDNLTRELQNFIIKVQVCLKLFYCKAINYACFTNEKDELMNLITTLFFKTGKIYETVFGLQRIKLNEEVIDMTKKYSQLHNISPQQLGIKQQFCLNEETLSMQESILEKEEKQIDDNIKAKEGQKDNSNFDFNSKGVTNIYFNDDQGDKKKIRTLLTKIRQMKKVFPKYFIYDSNNIKVDIDFDHDDNNIIPENILNKPSYVNDENLLTPILPKSRETMELDYKLLMPNHQSRITYAPNMPNKNDILFNDNDDIREMESVNNDNEIIRDNTIVGRKTLSPFNFIKVFNCVKFTKESGNQLDIRFPYETAIHLLKQIEKYKAPFEKMLIFANLGNEITNCVNDFWKDMEEFVKGDLLGVEAEQLMTIFIFILLKAQINDIVVHCKIIQLFTTSVIKSSMIGYYYSNAEASVSYIKNLKNIKELLKGNIDVFNENGSEVNDK